MLVGTKLSKKAINKYAAWQVATPFRRFVLETNQTRYMLYSSRLGFSVMAIHTPLQILEDLNVNQHNAFSMGRDVNEREPA